MQDQRPSAKEVTDRLDRLWQAAESAQPKDRPASATRPPGGRDPGSNPVAPFITVGQRVGKYLIREFIGHGAFGVVYRATDDELNRDVALKLPRPEVLGDRQSLRRFQSEATTAAGLDHPSIVPVFASQLNTSTPFIASMFCAGPDLGDWLQHRVAPVPDKAAAAFVASLADAVHYAHQQGVLHRDFKPSNVMLEPKPIVGDQSERRYLDLSSYDPRLTDFGLAKAMNASLNETRSSLLVGTPIYMAPEQLSSVVQPTCASDVYELGVVLYELLTLSVPFWGATYVETLDMVRSTEPISPKKLNADVSHDLTTIVLKCLEKDPSDRYVSADELRNDLNRIVADEPIRAQSKSAWGLFMRWCRMPVRIAQAAQFAVGLHSFLLVWVLLIALVGWALGSYPMHAQRKNFMDVFVVGLTMHGPMIWISWQLATGKRWAFLPSLIGSFLVFVIFVSSSMHEPVVFEHNYSTPGSKLTTFSALLMSSFWALALHVCAVPAWRKHKPGWC